MNKKLLIAFCLAWFAGGALIAQTVHPWHVVDAGGGRSTSGNFVLQSSIGQPAVQQMAGSGDTLESGFIPGLRMISGSSTTFSTSLATGWNLLALPVSVADSHKTTLFPTAISQAFNFNGTSYLIQLGLHPGSGYFVKFAAPAVAVIGGTTFAQESLAVLTGWNLIGPPSYPVLISDITPVGTTIISNYFGYATNYFIEDTLKPGKGYWVKVNQPGKLFIQAGSVIMPPVTNPLVAAATNPGASHLLPGVKSQDGIGYLSFVDATGADGVLFFSTSRTDLKPEFYELPPRAPDEVMDVRYGTGRMLEVAEEGKEREVPILLSTATYPVKITWKSGKPADGTALVIDAKSVNMNDHAEVTIQQQASHLILRMAPNSNAELPKEFALHQNYPNPFNPTTTIRYDLPVDARVSLRIYNALGQEVKVLTDENESAGFKTVDWNSTNGVGNTVSSGVYFYRLETVSVNNSGKRFTEVKKMVLIK